MAEWPVQAWEFMIAVTQVLRNVSPSLYRVACAGSVGESGYGQAGAPPCMSLQMFGEIQTNCGTFPEFRSELSCVRGTTFSVRDALLNTSGYCMNGLCFRTYKAVPVSPPAVQSGSGAGSLQSP